MRCKVRFTSFGCIGLLIGVVQGSCLGPLLLIISTNDIVEVFNDSTVCKLCTDYLKLYTVIRRDLTSLEQ